MLAALLLAPLAALHAAELKLAGIFTDHAVLQRDQPVPVWGRANAGTEVTVEFAGQTKTATADAAGQWLVKLDALPASAEPRALLVRAKDVAKPITVAQVVVGEVWLLAGGLEAARWVTHQPDKEAILAERPSAPPGLVRSCLIEMKTASAPADDVKASWKLDQRDTLSGVPALAHYLGQQLAVDLRIPIGIVTCTMAWPGQPLETWMSRACLESTPAAQPIVAYFASDAWKQRTTGTYEQRLAAWLETNQKLPLNPPPKPQPGDEVNARKQEPAAVWNAMVAPLAGLALRGIVWDHGEDEGSLQRAVQYGKLLPPLVANWRQHFGKSDLPFFVVQLTPHDYSFPHGIDGRLAAELRESQKGAAAEAGAYTVVTIDLGKDPHPRAVGPRIAQNILARTYGRKELAVDGPEVASAETHGNQVVVRFNHAEGGLRATGGKLEGFAIASSMFRWVWADAVIQGDTVVLSAPTVEQPEGVRYAYQDLPDHGATLVNVAGAPAGPFRTDAHLSCSGTQVKPGDRYGYNARCDLGIEDSRLPRILIIGDSISGHYLDGVRERMRGRANVIGESSMKKDTWASMDPRFYRADWASHGDDLKRFLAGRGPFDIVHFNNGIHNFARAKPGDEQPYAEQLRKVVAIIRESGAVCLFANSTGTLGDNVIPTAPRYLTNCRTFNAAAEAVMGELNVPVTDIYGLIQPRIKELISSDLIHPKAEASPLMADLIAARLTETLATLPKRKP